MSGQEIVQQQQAVATREQPSNMEIIQALARDPNVQVEKFAALLDLQIRMEARSAEQEFTRDFAAMKLRLPAIRKDGKVCQSDAKGGGKLYSFARWDDIQSVVDPILAEFGFTLSFTSEAAQTGVLMVAKLKHKAGHCEESRMQLPTDTSANKNALQGLGSARQYGKRYLTLDMLDLKLIDMDDDGRKGGSRFVTQQQADSIRDLMAELGIDKAPDREAKFLELMNAKSVSEIHADRYKEAITRLEGRRRTGK